jgi:hypothetical protein
MVTSVLVAKYGWHLPLYRQAKMLAAQGLDLDRSTLAFWVGYAAAELTPLYQRLKANLLSSVKLAEALIPTKAEPIRSKVPLRRFRYDAKHDHVRCPRGKILDRIKLRFGMAGFSHRRRDCAGCDLAALCLSPGRVTKAVVIVHEYPALLRARRRRERWTEQEYRLYQRHRWRSEAFHGEAKTWHGLARAVRARTCKHAHPIFLDSRCGQSQAACGRFSCADFRHSKRLSE